MFFFNFFERPNYEITITVFQALLVLARKYGDDPRNRDKYETIKLLCFSGVRHSEDARVLEQLLKDDELSCYRISSRKQDVAGDVVRHFFERSLCYHTLSHHLEELDSTVLEKYFNGIARLIDEPDVENLERLVNGLFPFDDERAMVYFHALNVLNHDDSYPDFERETGPTDERDGSFSPNCISGRLSPHMASLSRKRKMALLILCMYVEEKMNQSMARAGSWLGFSDVTPGHELESEVAASHPTSDKMLMKLRVFAELLQLGRFTYESKPEQLKKLLQLHIALMVYHMGENNLDSHVQALQLPEVEAAFQDMPEFSRFTLDNLFRIGNDAALKTALQKASDYNLRFLTKKTRRAEQLFSTRSEKYPGFLGTVSFFSPRATCDFVVVNKSSWTYLPLFVLLRFLDEKRLSTKKDTSISNALTSVLLTIFTLTLATFTGQVTAEQVSHRPSIR